MSAALDGTHLRVLQQEVDRLHNAVAHLVQSNADLRAAIEEEGDDEDRTYKQAIEDNIVTIAKYRAQAERLQAELAEGRHPLGGAQALPAEEPAAAAAAGSVLQQQQQQQQGSAGEDAPMAEAAAEQQRGGGEGMWM